LLGRAEAFVEMNGPAVTSNRFLPLADDRADEVIALFEVVPDVGGVAEVPGFEPV
jgi:hypothetical protein